MSCDGQQDASAEHPPRMYQGEVLIGGNVVVKRNMNSSGYSAEMAHAQNTMKDLRVFRWMNA